MRVTLVMVRVLPPVFVTVTESGAEVEAAGVPGNVSAVVESEAAAG